jgi:diguanylate cyclase (GGDEF)-like protein
VGLHAAVAFPVVVDGRPVAVLECFSEAVHRETPELLAVLGHAGAQLARVLERAANADRLRHEATHDTLTGLPNRAFFADRLGEALASACREDGARAAVALLDLDRFKEVNDTLGHQQGDRLLAQVGARLSAALRKSATIARVGGDEFGLVLPLAVDAADAVTTALGLQEALREPFLLEGVMVQVDVSIGMALYPDDGEDAETLVRRADIAMYEAKRTHAGHLLYRSEYDPSAPPGWAWPRGCAARSRTASSCCTTSPRSRSPAVRCAASRRSCAGLTLSVASWGPTSSSPSRSARG